VRGRRGSRVAAWLLLSYNDFEALYNTIMLLTRFIIRRFAEFLLSILVLAFVIFLLLYLAPGDPAKTLVGLKHVDPSVIAQIRAEHHLDDPMLMQFGRWVGNALQLDFGTSIRTGENVLDMVSPYVKSSAALILVSFILSLAVGLILGIVSAKRHGKLADKVINLFAMVGTSAPSFVIGIFFLYFFALTLGLFPIYGMGNGGFLDTCYHLALPSITLSFALSAIVIQITRVKFIGEERSDYVMFKRARGISGRQIVSAEMKNSLGPILTSSGLLLANLVGSVILVESVFGIPGIGSLIAAVSDDERRNGCAIFDPSFSIYNLRSIRNYRLRHLFH